MRFSGIYLNERGDKVLSSIKFELSFAELFRLLFYKKICPICNNKLIKKHKDDLLKVGWEKVAGDDYVYGNHYRRYFLFYCNNCNKDIKLNELEK